LSPVDTVSKTRQSLQKIDVVWDDANGKKSKGLRSTGRGRDGPEILGKSKTANERITLRRFGATIVANVISISLHILSVFVSLMYPACNAQASYCHLWPVRLYNIFPHYLINGTIFERKSLNTKCVFWFSLQFLSETSHSKNN
jgi:hypothetical protein